MPPLLDPAFDAALAPLDLALGAVPDIGIVARTDGTTTGRELLDIADYTLVTGSHHSPGLALSTSGTALQVLLSGAPGPGSTARRGVLNLVPTDRLRAPRWDPETGTIDLALHHSALAMVLALLALPRRILWMAAFETGQVYGDLHATGATVSGGGGTTGAVTPG